MIRGDRHLLSQAVANLIDNALKYGDPESGDGDIAIRVRQKDGRVVIEVADRGPGIPEGDRESVFDRFVRLEPSRSTPGNGLGLSLVRAVAHRHEATVTLSDNHLAGGHLAGGHLAGGHLAGGHLAGGHPGLKVQIEFPAWTEAI
jgi:signal transduction histidine kinase